MTKLCVGLIGVGRMAEICHLPILAKLPQVELVAFCDSDPDNLTARGDEYGVDKRYSDHHDLFDQERLDAVCIFVPPFAHTDAEIIAAQNGIHVFVEKPPALSMDKAHEIDAAIQKAGVISAVGFNRRYAKTSEEARLHLAGKTMIQALIHRLHGSRAAAYWWMLEELSGGAFIENTIHTVDLLRYLGGEYTSVSARGMDRRDKTQDLDIPLTICVTYTLAGGGVANITTSTALEASGHSQFLLIADGSLYELNGGRLTIDGEEIAEDEPDRADYKGEFSTFFEAIIEDDPERIRSPYSDGMKSLAAALAAVESAKNGGAEIDLSSPPYAAEEAQ